MSPTLAPAAAAFANAADVRLPALRAALVPRLTPVAARWLESALTEVAEDPQAALPRRFAEAGRRCGRTLLAAPAPAPAPAPAHEGRPGFGVRPDSGPPAEAGAVPTVCLTWSVDDAVRTLLLASAPTRALAADGPTWWAAPLYRGGDAAERRGVLRALGPLDPGDLGLPVVADALRTHDPRLVAAALGPYAARRLAAPDWRHGVLRCLHGGIPLSAVAGLAHRADAELRRMAAAYVRERRSAGRAVSADAVWLAGPPGPAPDARRPPPPDLES